MSSEALPFKSRNQTAGTAPLMSSERLFALLVSSVKDYGIFMLDPNGVVMTWNEGARAITGYAAEDVCGKHFSMFYTPEAILSKHPEEELRIAAETGRYEEEGWRVRKDGSRYWAHIIFSPIYEGDTLLGFAKVSNDLTEKMQLERERARASRTEKTFKMMVDSVRDYAIFMLDPNGNVMTWNEGAQRIKGYTTDEIVGKHFSIFYLEEDKDRKHPEQELEIAKREGRYEEEGWRLRKDGTQFWANVVITALYDRGTLVGFGKVTRDLSERKRMEEAKEENATRLEETNEELQRLAYVISHELQAPIATISRYGNLFSVRYKDVLGRDAFEFLQKTHDATKLIARMIDDLWTYARISKTNILQESVSITHCVNDALSEIGDLKGEAKITTNNLPSIQGNRQQLTFLFRELIKNSLRYRSSETPQVEISGRCENHGWLLSVKDNGEGIDKVQSAEVFQLFHRLRGGSEPTATGMGLAICKKIVHQHNGDIWFESEPGDGTTFFIWLPDRPADSGIRQR